MEKKRIVSTTITPEQHEALEKYAAENGTTMSSVIRKAILGLLKSSN